MSYSRRKINDFQRLTKTLFERVDRTTAEVYRIYHTLGDHKARQYVQRLQCKAQRSIPNWDSPMKGGEYTNISSRGPNTRTMTFATFRQEKMAPVTHLSRIEADLTTATNAKAASSAYQQIRQEPKSLLKSIKYMISYGIEWVAWWLVLVPLLHLKFLKKKKR